MPFRFAAQLAQRFDDVLGQQSVTRTLKLFSPTCGESGVPDKNPFGETASQPGPLSLEKVMESPSGSKAFAASAPV